MDLNALIGFVAVAATIAAVVLFLQSQKVRQTESSVRRDLESAQQNLQEVRKESGTRKEDADRLRKELQELSQKLRETKKKAFETKTDAKKKRADAEEPEQGTEITAKALYAAAEKTRARNEELNRELLLARKDLAELKAERERERPPAGDVKPQVDTGAEVRQLRARVLQLEKYERQLENDRRDQKPVVNPEELTRYRRRAETVSAAYMVAKGKVEVTEDRLQDVLRRFNALQVEHATLKAKLAGGRKRRDGAPNGAAEGGEASEVNAAAGGETAEVNAPAGSDAPVDVLPATAPAQDPAETAALAAAAAEIEAGASETTPAGSTSTPTGV